MNLAVLDARSWASRLSGSTDEAYCSPTISSGQTGVEKTAITVAIFSVPILATAIWLAATGRSVKIAPVIIAGIASFTYMALLRSPAVLPLPDFFEMLSENWPGKTLSITGTFLLIFLLPGVTFRSVGLTWRQNSGSLMPVFITGVIVLVMISAIAYFLAPSPTPLLENVLWQATMPGLDEELFFRGLLLLLLHQAFGKRFRLLGAETGWGLWVVTVIFGLLHGVTFSDGALSVSPLIVIGSGYLGFIMTWMRERTGSLVAPILFHNIFNVTQAFI